VSSLRKQGPRLLWVCPLVSFPRKQEPTQCHSCASSSPVRLSPPRERPAVPKAPPGEGATVSSLRKQEHTQCHSCASGSPGFFAPSPCHSCVSRNPEGVIPAQAAVQYASPYRTQGRSEPRPLRSGTLTGCGGDVSEPTLCHSCASRNPGFFAPTPRVLPAQAGEGVIPAQAAVQKETTGFPLSWE